MKLKDIKLPEFKRINRYLSTHFGEILLILILILISLLSFKQGLYLISNDNYSPELNPTLSVERYIESPAWRGYRVLGFASESEQADVFRSGMFTMLDTFLPNWSIGQMFSLLSLIIGVISTGYLVSFFIRDFVTTKYSKYIFLISGITYLSTLWTAWVFNFNMMPYITQFGFLPLLLLSAYLCLKEWNFKRVLFFVFATVLFTSSFVIATIFIVNIILLILFILYFAFLHRAKLKRGLILIFLFILTQIFWLVPFLQYTFSTSGDIINSYTNRAITANTIDLEAEMMTLSNSARFYTRLLGTTDDSSVDSYIFPMSEDFQAYDIYKVVGLLPFLLSVIGLVFVLFYKKWRLLPLWVVMFGCLFLIKNQNPPLGGIYLWLQENIPLFKQVFRWVSSKLGQAYLSTLVITSTISFVYIVDFLASFFNEKARKYFVLIPTILFVVSPLFYSEYLFKGQLFTNRALVDLPEQYYSLQEYLTEDEVSRIFYAPPANNGYFREYEWGFVGSQFLGYILPNPLMDMSLAIGSDVGEKAMLELTNDFNSGNLGELNRDLSKYDVKYILVDRSLVKGRYGYELNWEIVNKYTKSWEKIWSKDFLELYVIKEEESNKYVESYGSNDVLGNYSFVRKYPQEPVFSPLNIDLSDSVFNDNLLTKEFKYDGVNTILYAKYKEVDILKLPSTLEKVGSNLYISPAVPTLQGLGNLSYKKYEVPSSNSYFYNINNNVFSSEDLERGSNIYNTWGSIKNISVISENSLKWIDLTKDFSTSKPGDCSGGDYKILPNVDPQKKTSGFLLEGNTELPCLYTPIVLDKGSKYVGSVSINWESSDDTIIGYCLYSSNSKGCLNKEKFIYTGEGFGDIEMYIPTIIDGKDSLSLVLYALNPTGNKSSILVRDVKFGYSSQFKNIAAVKTVIDEDSKSLELNTGEKVVVEIPVLRGESSYIYSSSINKSQIWQPVIAEDRTLTYEFSFDNGLVQKVQGQYINQYRELFKTNPLKKYLWYWSGENVSNIPASVCLTYVGDDKCMVDSTFYDDIFSSEARIFLPSLDKESRMDASFNGISFYNETENKLQDFVVMEIPSEWDEFEYSPIFPREYVEIEAKEIGNSSSPSSYMYERADKTSRDTLLSIPQAKSDGWVAIAFTDLFFKFLPDDSRVYIDGWKQGWDISGMNEINSIYIFYWPNIISYVGYIGIISIPSILLFYILKKKKWIKRSH